MAIHINTDDDSDYAVATLTNIGIDYKSMSDIMSKIEKSSSKMQSKTLSTIKSHVKQMGLIHSACKAFSKQITNNYMYELECILCGYFAKQLRNGKYEAMLNKEKMFRIPVLDLRRVNKMSEDDLAILNYFGYFELQRHGFDGVFFNSFVAKSGRKCFITIEQNFNEKYVPLRAALYREYAYYLQIKAGTIDTSIEDVKLSNSFSTRTKHHAEWYACQKLYSSGRFNDIRRLIDGHMRKFYETKNSDELFRATLIKRMCRRYNIKLDEEQICEE